MHLSTRVIVVNVLVNERNFRKWKGRMRWKYLRKFRKFDCRTTTNPHTWKKLAFFFIGTNLLALGHIYFTGCAKFASNFYVLNSGRDNYGAVEVIGMKKSAVHTQMKAFKRDHHPIAGVKLNKDSKKIKSGLDKQRNTQGQSEQSLQTDLHKYGSIMTTTIGPQLAKARSMFAAKYDDDEHCNIPQLTAFHKSVVKYIKRAYRPIVNPCNPHARYPEIYTTDLTNKLIEIQPPHYFGLDDCCYRALYQDGSDSEPKFVDVCIPITKRETVIPEAVEYLLIQCTNTSEADVHHRVIPIEIFAFARLKPEIESRMARNTEKVQRENRIAHTDRLNVIILGFDGMSSMNFQRIMSKSYEFITETLKAFEFKGYTKTGDDSYPNLVPMLFGMSPRQLKSESRKGQSGRNPVPWNKFSAQGYATSFIEDSSWTELFSNGENGSKAPPVDFYRHPLMHPAANHNGNTTFMNSKNCYGNRPIIEVLHDYMKKVATAVGPDRRYFQLTWESLPTNDKLGYLGDDSLHETLEWFHEQGFTNNSVFILVSDHGNRYGAIRNVIQGRLEERMPMLYYIFPRWFREKYHAAMANMAANNNKLVSHFDFYPTLMDLLNTDDLTERSLMRRFKMLNASTKTSYPRGISLFLPVPAQRTCKQAGIQPIWCVCFNVKQVTKESKRRELANAVKRQLILVNRQLKEESKGLCMSLSFGVIVNVEHIDLKFHHVPQGKRSSSSEMYSISFKIKPEDAHFESKFLRQVPKGGWLRVDAYSRLDGKQYNNSCLKVQSDLSKVLCKCVHI